MAQQLQQENPDYQGKDLRVYLEGKGCDGFFYGVTFDHAGDSDIGEQQGPLKILCDSESLVFLKNSSIEWVDDERGRGFLVTNPQHRKFRGKFYKRKAWQNYFEQDGSNESPGPAG